MAQLYEQNGMLSEAEAAFQKNIEESDGLQLPSSRIAYARFLLHVNAPEKAGPLLKVLETGRDDVLDRHLETAGSASSDRTFLSAVLARMEGRDAEAQSLLSKLHQQRPDSVAVSSQLAAVLVDQDDEVLRARALQIADAAVRNSPNSAEAWATLGWVRLRLGDRSGADTSLVQALQLGKPSRDTLHYLAEFKRISGDVEGAKEIARLYREAKGPQFYGKRK